MSWTIRIALGLVLFYFLMNAIESRTGAISKLFPALSGTSAEEALKLRHLQEDLLLARANQQKSQAEARVRAENNQRLTMELQLLEQENTELERKSTELKQENDSLAQIARLKPGLDPSIENIVGKGTEALSTPSILTVGWRDEASSHYCSIEGQKLLHGWLRFVDLYSALRLGNSRIDRKSLSESVLYDSSLLKKIPDHQFTWITPLVDSLLDYHAVLTSQPDWESRLNEINNSEGKSELIDKIYQAGYPQSSDPCLTGGYAISVETIAGGFTTSVYLERWLYTFWLRRLSEDSMDATHSGLKLIQLMIDSAAPYSGRDHVYYLQPAPLQNDIGRDRDLIKSYRQLMLPSKHDDELVFWSGNDPTPATRLNLYAFSGPNHGQTISYVETTEVTPQDAIQSIHGQVYRGPADPGSALLYSIDRLESPANVYRPIETSSEEHDKIEQLLNPIFGSLWRNQNLLQGQQTCPRGSGQISSYAKGQVRFHIAVQNCSSWRGEGYTGPRILLVLTSDADSGLQIRHQYIGVRGNLDLDPGYLADLDDDGNIEVYLHHGWGLSRNSDLVELKQNSWSLLRRVQTRSEGGYEEILDMDLNHKLLH